MPDTDAAAGGDGRVASSAGAIAAVAILPVPQPRWQPQRRPPSPWLLYSQWRGRGSMRRVFSAKRGDGGERFYKELENGKEIVSYNRKNLQREFKKYVGSLLEDESTRQCEEISVDEYKAELESVRGVFLEGNKI